LNGLQIIAESTKPQSVPENLPDFTPDPSVAQIIQEGRGSKKMRGWKEGNNKSTSFSCLHVSSPSHLSLFLSLPLTFEFMDAF
jgi:hypothetical protein